MTVIYIDRVFVLNALTDYLLLLTAARLAGVPLRRKRLAFCAVLGGAYAAAVFLPGCGFLAHPACKTGAGLGMAFLAYRPQPRRLRLMALFLLLSGALAGMLLAVGLALGSPGQSAGILYRAEISWPVFIVSAAVFYGLVQFLFRQGVRHGRGEIMDITVTIGGKRQSVRALYDTGNTLCDPVSGEAVLVLEQYTLYSLWPEEVSAILRQRIPPEEKMVQLHRIRRGSDFSLLPFRSVGVSAGLMLAYRSDAITVGGRNHRRALLALSEGPLSDGGAYHALWGGEEGRADGKNLARHPAMDHGMDQAV
ncbi:MAG: sigma-E processing peptidase SpoIIGA [Oscillospiraceae bacterium]|nr:sigma-E processing peptidase SpoIIGA [Oscillospiraceae bacterium]